jgi:exodeoxyribonuclease V alpha subunit
MNVPALRLALKAGALRELDVYFAERVTRHLEQGRDDVALAAAMVSHAVGEGHVCVDLAQQAAQSILSNENFTGIPAPVFDTWKRQLQDSGVVGAAGEIKPLILDGDRLYLGRYWHFEQELASRLFGVARHPAPKVDTDLLQQGLARLFPPSDEMDWQQLAAAMAVLQSLVIISGGPGTGKTHTVTAILALLMAQAAASGQQLRIALATPTGKAAARLTESVRNARSVLDAPESVRNAIPTEALTLHRLLGVRAGRVTPRYNAQNPLHLDVLVVDEASMIDLPLMNRVLAALPKGARLIVLGDKDQLASVEAGSVFADLCGGDSAPVYSAGFIRQLQQLQSWQLPSPAENAHTLADNTVLLRKSYRFDHQSGIGHLARAVNSGDIQAVQSILSGKYKDVAWRTPAKETLTKELGEYAARAFAPVMQAKSPEQALDALEAFRILCAVRQGPAGVVQANRVVQQALANSGHIQLSGEFYAGRPIMVTRNDYHLGLFNGDIGILWPDPEANGALRAWFRLPDNSINSLMPGRLPDFETAFALTVHKSQGSEFARVLLLLPETDSPVLTRELVYTGITRAAKTVAIWGANATLVRAISRRVERTSGLLDRFS